MKYIPIIVFTILLTIAAFLLQIFAIGDGLMVWLGVPPVLTYIAAFFFGWIPPFGSIVGMVAAVDVWGWNWAVALLAFFGIYIWYGIMFVLGIFEMFKGVKWARARMSEKVDQKMANRNQTFNNEPPIIDQDGNNL